MRRDEPTHPVRRAEEVPAVALVEELDAAGCGDAEVDGLAGLGGQPVERLRGELDELGLAASPAARSG